MKRLLSVVLSFSVLCGFVPSRVEAKTNFINNNRAYIYKSRDGERVWIQGDSLPPINIKNKPVANSSSTSNSTSSSGGSSKIETGLKLLLLGVILWYGIKFKNWLGNNSITKGIKKVFSIPGEVTTGIGSLWAGACAGASKIFSSFNWKEGHGDENHENRPENSEEDTTESNNGDSASGVKKFLSWILGTGLALSSFGLSAK